MRRFSMLFKMLSGLALTALLLIHCTKEKELLPDDTPGLNGSLPIPNITVQAKELLWNPEGTLKAYLLPESLNDIPDLGEFQIEYQMKDPEKNEMLFVPTDSTGLVAGEIYDWRVVTSVKALKIEGDTALNFSYAGQVQDSKDPEAHLKDYDLWLGSQNALAAESDPSEFTLESQCAHVELILKNIDTVSTIKVNRLEIIAPEGIAIGGIYTMDLKNGGQLEAKTPSGKATLDLKEPAFIQMGQFYTAHIMMPPFTLQYGDELKVLVYTDEGIIETEYTADKVLEFPAGASRVLRTEIHYIYVERLEMDKAQLCMKEGEQNSISVKIYPENAHNQIVTWTTSAPEIVQVDNQGNLSATNCGAAVITASVEKAGISVFCPVNVVTTDVTYETVMAGDIEIPLVKIKAGSFMMGATASQESESNPDEKPVHRVNLSSYYIGQYEVSQELWEYVMGDNPSTFSGQPDHPVEHVSWNEIVNEFLPKLNEITGKNFTLPTEAQWEYAARGAEKSHDYIFSGSNILEHVGWFYGEDDSTFPIGTKLPNELGIYDMSGSIYEWCSDWIGAYTAEEQTDPTGPETGEERVMRGGSCIDFATHCRVSLRRSMTPEWGFSNHGLRLCLQEL